MIIIILTMIVIFTYHDDDYDHSISSGLREGATMEIEDAQRQLQLPPQTTGMMIVMT